jgi:hypothetical protein
VLPKQVKEAALFARVEQLRAAKRALQAQLRPLLEQHEALAACLPFHRLQARRPARHVTGATCMQLFFVGLHCGCSSGSHAGAQV